MKYVKHSLFYNIMLVTFKYQYRYNLKGKVLWLYEKDLTILELDRAKIK